jgi:hypothetical protein
MGSRLEEKLSQDFNDRDAIGGQPLKRINHTDRARDGATVETAPLDVLGAHPYAKDTHVCCERDLQFESAFLQR